MILIFGGTTEGRMVISVCEEAGKHFYYSTKTDSQKVEMHNGVRLCGAMTGTEISTFCNEHHIACIVDAAHPFAENLHKAIAESAFPVIRLQRSFDPHVEGVVYCKDYREAMDRIATDGTQCLLALSGVNTIAKLKDYWTNHHTVFRILDRQDSIETVDKCGFDMNNVIFYNTANTLPTVEDEEKTMTEVGCDAILTKESGDSGGFRAKVQAALRLGIRVYAVEHPQLPAHWTYATGRYGLRRAIEKFVPDFFPLKTGLTTGACATAATKAAMMSLLFDDDSEEVSFALPDGEILTIPVEHVGKGVATVVKDHNDDPDVTKGCRITAKVEMRTDSAEETSEENKAAASQQQVRFLQGEGVGTVTLPGLGIPVGEPAVNPTPRKIICDEIARLTQHNVDVTISVANGAELAKLTFNPRVGVVSGISILGTSGIVHPLSNEAFINSIRRELQVAWAIGCREIGLVAGMKSEKALKEARGLRCVHYGNFIGDSLKAAQEIGFRHVVLAIMIGKAVKLAEGHLDTHSHKFVMNKEFLKGIAAETGGDPSLIDGITMARELWRIMPDAFFSKITDLCMEHCRTVFTSGELNILLICDKKQ